MNTKKSQFLTAVRILALNDPFILNLAQCVHEADLPVFPGAAALLFVTTLSSMREQNACSALRRHLTSRTGQTGRTSLTRPTHPSVLRA